MTASYDAANHIVQFNSTAYSYDANGNLLTEAGRLRVRPYISHD
jgi:YD repeat-containing protein